MSAAVATPPPVQPAAPPLGPAANLAPPGGPPAVIATAELWRFSVADYEKMSEVGIFSSGDQAELLDGIVVVKMPPDPPQVVATELTQDALRAVLPAGWTTRGQAPVSLDASSPEPDVAVARGSARDYSSKHPTANELALVAEVSDSSIGRDQRWKKGIYARNGIATYWIVNLVDRTLEVYTAPAAGEYTQARTLAAADRVEVVLDGAAVGTLAVADLLP